MKRRRLNRRASIDYEGWEFVHFFGSLTLALAGIGLMPFYPVYGAAAVLSAIIWYAKTAMFE